MRSLRARFVLFGAVLPGVLLVASHALARTLFERALLAEVDEALHTHAAVEAVSLFDAPDGAPHIHLDRSPLATEPTVSAVAIFDASGRSLAVYPDTLSVPASPPEVGPPRTVVDPRGRRVREFVVDVRSPGGMLVRLWLGHALDHHEAILAAERRTTLGVVLASVGVLLAVQLLVAQRLRRRLHRLGEQLHLLRHGQALPDVSSEPKDEIGGLQRALAETARRLDEARSAEERLVSEAAHELRTPLATMRTAIDVTLRRDRSTDELRAVLDEVRGEVDRLARLSSDLLDLRASRADREPRVEVDLAPLVEASTAAFRGVATDRAVALTLDLRPVQVWVVPSELRRATDNLIANALHHARARVRVTVSSGDVVRVTVEDDGSGIRPEERELVFLPFHRGSGRASEHGKGLGLAIVRDVASRHGGRAYVDDSTVGARLVLELPSTQAPRA